MTSRLLENRTAIITGANQGLGQAIARSFVIAGASTILCARDKSRLAQVKSELEDLAYPAQRVIVAPCDVSNAAEVNQLVNTALEQFPQIHILVNNAGIYGPKGPIEDVNWEEWTQAISVNMFGSVLFTRALIPQFKRHGYGKVIQLSGGGATKPLPFLSAYAASKAAIVRFAETLAEEVRNDHIDVNCIAPGMLNTQMLDEIIEAGPKRVGEAYYELAMQQKNEGGVPLERGANLAVYLASAESDGLTGKLISAVWDPWETLNDHLSDLQRTDVYTLRRIVPHDRDLGWGNRE